MSESPSLEYLTQVDGRLFTTIYCGYHILSFFGNPEWKNYGLTETNMGSERCPRCFFNIIFRGAERRLYWGWLKPNSLPSLEGSWSLMVPTSRSFWSSSFCFCGNLLVRPHLLVLFSVFPKFIYQLDGGFNFFFEIFSPILGKWSNFDDHIFQRVWFNHQQETVVIWFIPHQKNSMSSAKVTFKCHQISEDISLGIQGCYFSPVILGEYSKEL